MSRAYRIRVHEQLQRVLRASDHISTKLELLEILPAESMAALLAQELERCGLPREGTQHVRHQNGVTVAIDPATGTVSVRADAEENVNLKASRDSWGDEEWSSALKDRHAQEARQQLNKELQQQADKRRAELARKVTDTLEAELAGLKKELDQIVNRVTGQALKQKAAQLGQIKEMTEDPVSGALTIVLEV